MAAKDMRRAECLRVFNDDPACSVALGTMNIAGVGLNLTIANVVILLDPADTLAKEGQAINRVIRLGQTRPVQVYRVFTRHTVEERLLAYRSTKGQLDVKPGEENDVDGPDATKQGGSNNLAAAGNFVEGGEGGGETASMERLRVLLGAKECITE